MYFVFDHCFSMPLHQTLVKQLQKYFLTTEDFDTYVEKQQANQKEKEEKQEMQRQIKQASHKVQDSEHAINQLQYEMKMCQKELEQAATISEVTKVRMQADQLPTFETIRQLERVIAENVKQAKYDLWSREVNATLAAI